MVHQRSVGRRDRCRGVTRISRAAGGSISFTAYRDGLGHGHNFTSKSGGDRLRRLIHDLPNEGQARPTELQLKAQRTERVGSWADAVSTLPTR